MIRVVPALVRVDHDPRQAVMALMVAPPGLAGGYYEIGAGGPQLLVVTDWPRAAEPVHPGPLPPGATEDAERLRTPTDSVIVDAVEHLWAPLGSVKWADRRVTSRAALATGKAFAAAWCGPRPVAALVPAAEPEHAALCADVTMRGARR